MTHDLRWRSSIVRRVVLTTRMLSVSLSAMCPVSQQGLHPRTVLL